MKTEDFEQYVNQTRWFIQTATINEESINTSPQLHLSNNAEINHDSQSLLEYFFNLVQNLITP